MGWGSMRHMAVRGFGVHCAEWACCTQVGTPAPWFLDPLAKDDINMPFVSPPLQQAAGDVSRQRGGRAARAAWTDGGGIAA